MTWTLLSPKDRLVGLGKSIGTRTSWLLKIGVILSPFIYTYNWDDPLGGSHG